MNTKNANGAASKTAKTNTTTASRNVQKTVWFEPADFDELQRRCKKLKTSPSDYLVGLVERERKQREAKTITTTSTKASNGSDRPAEIKRRKGEATVSSDRIDDVRSEAAQAKLDAAKKTLTVEVGALDYGFLTAAALVHNSTPELIVAHLVEENVGDWANDAFEIRDC